MTGLPADVAVPPTVQMTNFISQHPVIFWSVGVAVAAAIIVLIVLVRRNSSHRKKEGRL